MKLKSIFIGSLLLFSFANLLKAGEVTITPMSTGETAQFFSNVSKVEVGQDYYGNTSLEVYNEQGEIVSQRQVTSRTKITFGGSGEEGLDNAISSETTISFYPNPAIDFIHIVGLEVPTKAKLYNLNGLLILSTMETNINVSGLPEGSYVLQVGSQCFKVLIQ